MSKKRYTITITEQTQEVKTIGHKWKDGAETVHPVPTGRVRGERFKLKGEL